jgi:dipeptidyl aminopeptidase/acylaminoacyl peptidase
MRLCLLICAAFALPALSADLRHLSDVDLWKVAGPFTSRPAAPVKIIDSPTRDASPNVSRDGRRIAFSSTRSGSWEVWTCTSDGSNPFQVTRLLDTPVGSTRWSPDGRRIAFDGQKPGHYDLYVVNADGSGLRQLTRGASTDVKPSWSKDGRWIYFTSNSGGVYQVWKISPEGGDAVQLTRGGGYTPFESLDGRFVYYVKAQNDPTLWRIPVAGGKETSVLSDVVSNRWVIVEKGICILNMESEPRPRVEFYDFATGKRRPMDLLPAEGHLYGGGTAIAAPPDGSWLLIGMHETSRSK